MPKPRPRDELVRKYCPVCNQHKPDSEYRKNKRTPDGLMYCCRDCANVMRRQEYRRNPDKYIAYRQENKERSIKYSREYYAANADVIKYKNKQYRDAHPLAKTWRRLWAKRNPERNYEQKREYRARKLNAPGKYTAKEWEGLKHYYNFTCLCCGLSEPEITLTADHVVPLVRGGSNDILNIQPLCRSCNCRKHTNIVDYRKGSYRQSSFF